MALISSMLRSSEPGALLLLICLIALVTSAGRTAGTGSTTILGIASQSAWIVCSFVYSDSV